MIDVGQGSAIVLIPGIQGRWEWMRPTVDALAAQFRVITSSLPGEPGETASKDGRFDEFVGHLDRLLDRANVSSAVICGVSFGGLVALRYAAMRPERVRALILVSTPGPQWQPAPYQAKYLRWPTLSSPIFLAGAAQRVWTELRATIPSVRDRLAFCVKWTRLVVGAPGIPSRMGARAALAASERFDGDCRQVAAPTLVITGERELDKVVSPDVTMEYVRLIPGAELHVFERTGHLGPASAPDRFAAIVSAFVNRLPPDHA